jgi:hypothetical protein
MYDKLNSSATLYFFERGTWMPLTFVQNSICRTWICLNRKIPELLLPIMGDLIEIRY